MKTLLSEISVVKELRRTNDAARSMLVVFPDALYLRTLLKACAKAFFHADEGSRIAKLIEEESFLDCKILPAEGAKLTAETAAALYDETLLHPVEGDRKLIVLDAFQTVTPLVQNKLLKLLEEPPAGVYFLLGTTAEHAILPTVLSRVSRYPVQPFSKEQIFAALRRAYGNAEGIEEAALACGGIYSAAETLVKESGELRLAEEFLSGENTVRVCREVGEKKPAEFFSAVLQLLRDVVFYQSGQSKYCMLKQAASRLAKRFPLGVAISAVGLASAAERDIRFNTNYGQAAYMLALSISEEREKWLRLS